MNEKINALMNEKINALLKIIQENPNSPIVPMVVQDIVADDCCARWMGGWGEARIDEYYVGDGHIFFRDDDDPEDVLDCILDYEELAGMTDEQVKARYAALPWVRCIVVDINLP